MKYLFLLAFLFCHSYIYGQSSVLYNNFVVLPYDKNAYTSLPKNSVPDTLNEMDFNMIDQKLSVCIEKYNRDQTIQSKRMAKNPDNGFKLEDFVINLSHYSRQYMVARNGKGEKEVWVNCFCTNAVGNYWRKEVVFVRDGGNCFFHLKINLTKRVFSDFRVNGEG